MRKIPTLFVRDEKTRLVTPVVAPGCEWVLDGLGAATRKFDGTCAMIRDGRLFKRYDAKAGRTPPPDFEACQEPDPITGHLPGWLPVGDGPEDRWFREAFGDGGIPDGTYELCGPKVQGNAEKMDCHVLVSHGDQKCPECPHDFDGLKAFFAVNDIEGIVWHHPDGRMCKLKLKDFGFKRPR